MRIAYIFDTLKFVDIYEIAKMGVKFIKIYEGVVYRENFKISPFRNIFDKLFTLRQKHKEDINDLIEGLFLLLMNALYGIPIRKAINELYRCKSQH